MSETQPPEAENARIVAELREAFGPVALRLTPETEPAVMYLVARDEPALEEPVQ